MHEVFCKWSNQVDPLASLVNWRLNTELVNEIFVAKLEGLLDYFWVSVDLGWQPSVLEHDLVSVNRLKMSLGIDACTLLDSVPNPWHGNWDELIKSFSWFIQIIQLFSFLADDGITSKSLSPGCKSLRMKMRNLMMFSTIRFGVWRSSSNMQSHMSWTCWISSWVIASRIWQR